MHCRPAPVRTGICTQWSKGGLPQARQGRRIQTAKTASGSTYRGNKEHCGDILDTSKECQCAALTDALLQLWLHQPAGGRPTPARAVGGASAVRPTPAGAGITVGLAGHQAPLRCCGRTGFVPKRRHSASAPMSRRICRLGDSAGFA